MADTARTTFSLRADILAPLNDPVARGAAPSKDAFVEGPCDESFRGHRAKRVWRGGRKLAATPCFSGTSRP